jgi:uncharacterized membrane protein
VGRAGAGRRFVFVLILFFTMHNDSMTLPTEEESEEEEEESEEEEEEVEVAPQDGLQTPSGLATPSGLTSVVSTVAGGLETPDFLELRKSSGRAPSEAVDSGPRSLYQVVPEKQTNVRGLMGSERGYDVGAVAAGSHIPVLGDERGTKVMLLLYSFVALNIVAVFICGSNFLYLYSARPMGWMSPSMHQNWKGCRKKSCGASTMHTHVAMREFREARRTFRTWWRRRRRRDRSWTRSAKNAKRARTRSSSSSNSCCCCSLSHGFTVIFFLATIIMILYLMMVVIIRWMHNHFRNFLMLGQE